MFYDLHVECETASKMAEMARRLGWHGLGLAVPYGKEWMFLKAKGLDFVSGVVIREGNAGKVRNIIRQVRRKFEIVIVEAGGLEFNREVLSMPEVDVLSRVDNFDLDYVMCQLAAKNNIAIEFNFHKLVENTGETRTRVLSDFYENAKLVRKYGAPFIITSGAASEWDLRSPSELIAFGKMLGFGENKVREALSDRIVRENRKRMSKDWIAPGVRVISK